MSSSKSLKWVLVCLFAIAGPLWGADSTLQTEGRVIPEFQLIDAVGNVTKVAPQTQKQLTVVCFLGTECPLARYYGPRLSGIATEYARQNVRFIGVNSNSHDSADDVAAFSKDFEISFPIFKDPGNKIADLFGARYMAEVFVLDQSLAVRYCGRVDDQYQPGVTRGQPTRNDLRIALDQLLAGKIVSVPRTDTTGCVIGRIKTPLNASVSGPEVTYCRQVSRILNQHCIECHRPGEIGPFSLTDYEEITGWGDTIIETVDAGRMPPWHANPKHGQFHNSRLILEADKQTLRDWVKGGMPYGEKSDLPEPKEYQSGWQLSHQPDLVLKMRDRPFRVPATGAVEYQYFVVDPQFEEDRWVSGSQVIPGSRPTVHHCIVFVRPPDGTDVRGVGYLTGYVPGQRSSSFPSGYARRVPAGSKFVFQMHYTPNGVEQTDLTQMGMTFIPESQVTHEVFTLIGIDQEFEIPPQVSDFPVHGKVNWFPKRAELLAIIPHMHVRGKGFEVTSLTGEQSEILLDVPRYDFKWQHVYELSKPMMLDQVDQLKFTARFDNSKNNPSNPDPSQTVTWGDQTWEEMAIAFFEVSEPRVGSTEPEPQRNKQRLILKEGEKEETQSTEAFVTDFFKKFDKNRDDVVEPHETSLAFRRFGFRNYDENHDGKLSREEIRSATQRRQKR